MKTPFFSKKWNNSSWATLSAAQIPENAQKITTFVHADFRKSEKRARFAAMQHRQLWFNLTGVGQA